MVCYDACFIAYMNSSEKVSNYLKETGFATKSGGFIGRSTENGGMNWFKHGDGTDRSFVTDISKGELGDIVFVYEDMTNSTNSLKMLYVVKTQPTTQQPSSGQ